MAFRVWVKAEKGLCLRGMKELQFLFHLMEENDLWLNPVTFLLLIMVPKARKDVCNS